GSAGAAGALASVETEPVPQAARSMSNVGARIVFMPATLPAGRARHNSFSRRLCRCGRGRSGGGRRSCRRGIGFAAIAAGACEVALLVAVFLEVGFIPATTGQTKLRRGQLATNRLRSTG